MSKRTAENEPDTAKRIELEDAIQYICVGFWKNDKNVAILLRQTVLLPREKHPQWLLLNDNPNLLCGDIVSVKCYGPLLGHELCYEDKMISAIDWPIITGMVVEYDRTDFDEITSAERFDILACVIKRVKDDLKVADPRKPGVRMGGERLIRKARIDNDVWDLPPHPGTLVCLKYHLQKGLIMVASNNTTYLSLHIPKSLVFYEFDQKFEVMNDVVEVLRLTKPPIEAIGDGLKIINNNNKIPELTLAAAACFHSTYLSTLADERSFMGKMTITVEEETVTIKTTANIEKKKEANKTGVYQTFQKGQPILVSFAPYPDVDKKNFSVIRAKVDAFELIDKDHFNVTAIADKMDFSKMARVTPLDVNGFEAKFFPGLTAILDRVSRDELFSFKLAEILENKAPTNKRRILALTILGAPVEQIELKELPTMVELMDREDGGQLTDEQSLAVHMIERKIAEVGVVAAKAGSGKTEVLKQCLVRLEPGWNENPDEMTLVTSIMNRPLVELAKKVYGKDLRFIVLQSANFLAKQSSVWDNYHHHRFTSLLTKLFEDRESSRWTRIISDEEHRIIQVAINACSRIFTQFDERLEKIEDVEDATDNEKDEAIMRALEILIDVYRPKFVIATISSIFRFRVLDRFSKIIVEEAGTVPTIHMIRLLIAATNLIKIVLIGDIKQLHCHNTDVPIQIINAGFKSILEALENSDAIRLAPLNRTFRFSEKLVPIIADFSYDGILFGGVTREGLSRHLLWPPNVKADDLLIVDVSGEVTTSITKSKANLQQAQIAGLFACYFTKFKPELKVAVLSMYSAQQELNKEEVKDMQSVATAEGVDANQGAEFDICILTTTAQTSEKEKDTAGFYNDVRRMTVAFTRAKEGLIIIADVEALRRTSNWGRFWEICDQHGVPKVDMDFLNWFTLELENMNKKKSQTTNVLSPATMMSSMNIEETEPSGSGSGCVEMEMELPLASSRAQSPAPTKSKGRKKRR